MNTNDWLQSLKVGDEVAVYGYRDGPVIGHVVRATKNFVTVGSTKFRRRDGNRAGRDPWNLMSIEPLSDALRISIKSRLRRAKATHKFISLSCSFVCERLELDWLENAVSVMEKANDSRKPKCEP